MCVCECEKGREDWRILFLKNKGNRKDKKKKRILEKSRILITSKQIKIVKEKSEGEL